MRYNGVVIRAKVLKDIGRPGLKQAFFTRQQRNQNALTQL